MPKLVNVGTKNHLVLAHVYDDLRRFYPNVSTVIHEENWAGRKLILKNPKKELLESLRFLRVTLTDVE